MEKTQVFFFFPFSEKPSSSLLCLCCESPLLLTQNTSLLALRSPNMEVFYNKQFSVTPAGCPTILLSSDWVRSHRLRGAVPQDFPSPLCASPPLPNTHTHFRCWSQAQAIRASDQPAVDWRFHRPPPWVLFIC